MNEFLDSGNPFPYSFLFPGIMLVFVQKIAFIRMKIRKKLLPQSCSFWLKYAPNRLSAGASPQIQLGELTALPRLPSP